MASRSWGRELLATAKSSAVLLATCSSSVGSMQATEAPSAPHTCAMLQWRGLPCCGEKDIGPAAAFGSSALSFATSSLISVMTVACSARSWSGGGLAFQSAVRWWVLHEGRHAPFRDRACSCRLDDERRRNERSTVGCQTSSSSALPERLAALPRPSVPQMSECRDLPSPWMNLFAICLRRKEHAVSRLRAATLDVLNAGPDFCGVHICIVARIAERSGRPSLDD